MQCIVLDHDENSRRRARHACDYHVQMQCAYTLSGYNVGTTGMKQAGVNGVWNENGLIWFNSALCHSKFSHPPGSAGHIKSRGRCCTCVVALTDDANTKKDKNASENTEDISLTDSVDLKTMSQLNCSSERSLANPEVDFFNSSSLFFKALANSCLITVSTVPISTSKCLLLPLPQLPCGMCWRRNRNDRSRHLTAAFRLCRGASLLF